MTNSNQDSGRPRGRRSKVERLIDEYGFQGMGEELERLWTRDEDGKSLRELADYFNQELLRRAMSDAGMQPLEGEVENVYRLLTNEEVSRGDQTRAVRQLEREGIDIENLQGDFVSYQAIRTYLRNHRGVEYEHDTRSRVEKESENIQQLRGRLTTVAQSKIDQLRETGELDVGSPRVLVDVRVICEDCGRQYDLETLFDRRACDCATDD